jgi:molybdopterin molybdotransferase
MISLDQHLERCLAPIKPLGPVETDLLAAQGAVLAEDVISPLDLPGFDNSAMDGYAVTVADVAGATEQEPVVLPVVEDVPAGSTRRLRLLPGQSMRIMTGAPVPEGAQAVVPVELSDGGLGEVTLRGSASAGQHLRLAATDVRRGEVVLKASTVLGPGQLALLAAVGRGRVLVRPSPRVLVLSTGSELVEPGTVPGYGQVVDSNGVMLAASVVEAGGQPRPAVLLADDPGIFLRALTEQLGGIDLVVTSGGVSAGAYDTVKEVLSGLGTVWFGKVAMQPGMPQGFGTVGPDATPIFTLPGNPASAFVSFEMFVRPAIRRLAGRADLFRRSLQAVALDSWTSPVGKVQLARCELGTASDGHRVARLAGGQGSFALSGLAGATALAVVPEEVHRVDTGDQVRCLVLDGRPG